MTARVQTATSSRLPILLRYDTVLGHSWGASVDRELDYYTDVLAFAFANIVARVRSSGAAP